MSFTEKRIEGPTPAGGAYAIAYVHDGAVEIVEFDAAGRPIARTYGTVGEPEDEPGA